jgi:hypothetical protein
MSNLLEKFEKSTAGGGGLLPPVTQVSHGLEKTLANLPPPIEVASFAIHGTPGSSCGPASADSIAEQRDAITVKPGAADILNEVAAHDNDVRIDASKTTGLQICTASDEDAAFQCPPVTPSNPTPPQNA